MNLETTTTNDEPATSENTNGKSDSNCSCCD